MFASLNPKIIGQKVNNENGEILFYLKFESTWFNLDQTTQICGVSGIKKFLEEEFEKATNKKTQEASTTPCLNRTVSTTSVCSPVYECTASKLTNRSNLQQVTQGSKITIECQTNSNTQKINTIEKSSSVTNNVNSPGRPQQMAGPRQQAGILKQQPATQETHSGTPQKLVAQQNNGTPPASSTLNPNCRPETPQHLTMTPQKSPSAMSPTSINIKNICIPQKLAKSNSGTPSRVASLSPNSPQVNNVTPKRLDLNAIASNCSQSSPSSVSTNHSQNILNQPNMYTDHNPNTFPMRSPTSQSFRFPPFLQMSPNMLYRGPTVPVSHNRSPQSPGPRITSITKGPSLRVLLGNQNSPRQRMQVRQPVLSPRFPTNQVRQAIPVTQQIHNTIFPVMSLNQRMPQHSPNHVTAKKSQSDPTQVMYPNLPSFSTTFSPERRDDRTSVSSQSNAAKSSTQYLQGNKATGKQDITPTLANHLTPKSPTIKTVSPAYTSKQPTTSMSSMNQHSFVSLPKLGEQQTTKPNSSQGASSYNQLILVGKEASEKEPNQTLVPWPNFPEHIKQAIFNMNTSSPLSHKNNLKQSLSAIPYSTAQQQQQHPQQNQQHIQQIQKQSWQNQPGQQPKLPKLAHPSLRLGAARKLLSEAKTSIPSKQQQQQQQQPQRKTITSAPSPRHNALTTSVSAQTPTSQHKNLSKTNTSVLNPKKTTKQLMTTPQHKPKLPMKATPSASKGMYCLHCEVTFVHWMQYNFHKKTYCKVNQPTNASPPNSSEGLITPSLTNSSSATLNTVAQKSLSSAFDTTNKDSSIPVSITTSSTRPEPDENVRINQRNNAKKGIEIKDQRSKDSPHTLNTTKKITSIKDNVKAQSITQINRAKEQKQDGETSCEDSANCSLFDDNNKDFSVLSPMINEPILPLPGFEQLLSSDVNGANSPKEADGEEESNKSIGEEVLSMKSIKHVSKPTDSLSNKAMKPLENLHANKLLSEKPQNKGDTKENDVSRESNIDSSDAKIQDNVGINSMKTQQKVPKMLTVSKKPNVSEQAVKVNGVEDPISSDNGILHDRDHLEKTKLNIFYGPYRMSPQSHNYENKKSRVRKNLLKKSSKAAKPKDTKGGKNVKKATRDNQLECEEKRCASLNKNDVIAEDRMTMCQRLKTNKRSASCNTKAIIQALLESPEDDNSHIFLPDEPENQQQNEFVKNGRKRKLMNATVEAFQFASPSNDIATKQQKRKANQLNRLLESSVGLVLPTSRRPSSQEPKSPTNQTRSESLMNKPTTMDSNQQSPSSSTEPQAKKFKQSPLNTKLTDVNDSPHLLPLNRNNATINHGIRLKRSLSEGTATSLVGLKNKYDLTAGGDVTTKGSTKYRRRSCTDLIDELTCIIPSSTRRGFEYKGYVLQVGTEFESPSSAENVDDDEEHSRSKGESTSCHTIKNTTLNKNSISYTNKQTYSSGSLNYANSSRLQNTTFVAANPYSSEEEDGEVFYKQNLSDNFESDEEMFTEKNVDSFVNTMNSLISSTSSASSTGRRKEWVSKNGSWMRCNNRVLVCVPALESLESLKMKLTGHLNLLL